MKINVNAPYIKDAKTSTEPRDRAAAKAAPESVVTEEKNNDVVNLSDRSRLIARATELASAAPETRAEKVEQLRGQISAGTYNVSGQVVAEAMIRKSITEV